MGHLIKTFMAIALLTVSTFACSEVPVSGNVLREVRPHVYRPIAGARVVAISGPNTWVAVSDRSGRYTLLLQRCGTILITAVEPANHFEFQTLAFPIDDMDPIIIDIVSDPRWQRKQRK
jgi:hypothetical protein